MSGQPPEHGRFPGQAASAVAQGILLGLMSAVADLKFLVSFEHTPTFSFCTESYWLCTQCCLRAQKPSEGSEGRERFQNSEEGRGERGREAQTRQVR